MIWNVPHTLPPKYLVNGMTKKNPKIRMRSGGEYDALTKARQFYCYLDNSKVVKKIKRGYNKRFRKEGKKESKNDE
jgi:hypothetical protein